MTDSPEASASQSKTKNPKSEINLPFPLPVMVESLLFVASEPVPVMQIAEALEVKLADVEQALTELNAEIIARGVRVQRKGDKVQLTTQPECAPFVEKFLGLDLTTRLSKPALETLAIIAYQQPVTRAQIEHVRGVNCDAVLSTLLNRGLIEEVGRLETAGRPIQYGTTFAFLQHFGLRGLEDMPLLQPEETATLQALAEQGQAIAVDLATPGDQSSAETTPPLPDQPVILIETQLPLLGADVPAIEQSLALAEEVDGSPQLEEATVKMTAAVETTDTVELVKADRVVEDTASIGPGSDQPEVASEPQSGEEESSNENAAI
jgi:segregation and condensation protein B